MHVALVFFTFASFFIALISSSKTLQPPPLKSLHGSQTSDTVDDENNHKLSKRYNPQKYGTIGWMAMHGNGGYGGGGGCPGMLIYFHQSHQFPYNLCNQEVRDINLNFVGCFPGPPPWLN